MRPFEYVRATDPDTAIGEQTAQSIQVCSVTLLGHAVQGAQETQRSDEG